MLGGKKHNSPGMLGKRHSEDVKRRIALSNSIAHKGKRHTEETKKLMSESHSGEKAYNWKGDNVGYVGLHRWVAKMLGKPSTCQHCQVSGLSGRKIHWANKSGKYLRKLTDWIRLCAKCHGKYDRRVTTS